MSESHHPDPTPPAPRVEPRARARRFTSLVAAVLLGILGGWLGLNLAGSVQHEVGPLETSMRVLPGWDGGTTIDIPPLGQLELDTHSGPLAVEASLQGVDVADAQAILQSPDSLDGLQAEAAQDLRSGLQSALLRGLVGAVLGAAVLSMLALRRVRTTVASGATAAVAMGVSVAVGLMTVNHTALAEPRYTGLLTSAPSVVGNAEDIFNDFSVYGDQLARIVQNVSGLYTVTSQLPILGAQDGLVRVLHVSDLHLAPHAWDIIDTVARQYDVDVIVDSGDITDRGSQPENRYVREIRHLPTPYVWVRGNHDSVVTEAAIRKVPNAVVLDGGVREVAGLRFLGAGDPTFTPDKSADRDPTGEAVRGAATVLSETADRDGDVDVVVFHDPSANDVFDGKASMVLSGHVHYRKVDQMDEGTWTMIQGSTGGSGLRALESPEPSSIQLSVLYVDPATAELRAYDDIRLGGLGLASAGINRHVVPDASADDSQLVAPDPSDP